MLKNQLNTDNKVRRIYRIILLFSLYLSQGLPFGYQATALPVYLRESGVSLTLIGFSTVLAAPWLLKIFWAPLVDSYWNKSIGKRKSWIIPLQLLLFTSVLSASFASSSGIILLMINIFIMNLAAATQDIAVDGLAVDILGENELGYGNAAQVVGYKTGMIISGGLLVWLTQFFAWKILFMIMAVITLIPLGLILLHRETGLNTAVIERITPSGVLRLILKSINKVSFRWLIFFSASYKFGEIMIDVMYKPFLIDSGMKGADIGLWVGTFGMAASIAGSAAGGLIASRLSVYRALIAGCIMRLLPLVYITSLTFIIPSHIHVVTATILEHFFGGLLTTALFAFMMSNVDRRIGATHYTMLAAIEVSGKMPGALLSGLVTEAAGYSLCFITGTFISLAVIFILPAYKRNLLKEQI